MLFVIDTNTLVSAILKPGGVPMQAMAAAQAKGKLVFTEETKKELLSVVQRAKFDKYVTLQERMKTANGILFKATLVTIEKDWPIPTPPILNFLP